MGRTREERAGKKTEKKHKKKRCDSTAEGSKSKDASKHKRESEEDEVRERITKDTSSSGKKISKERKSKEERRREREQKKEAKSAEKESLLNMVPKTDEHGISYTKIQIRRMVRRVKRGLPPVPTEEEERERLRQEKIEKELEERELAGMLYNKEEEADEDEEKEDTSEADGSDDEEDGNGVDIKKSAKETTLADDGEESKATMPAKKKAKRSKPVPPDYVCQACKNSHHPSHWIYDCPDKVRMPGTNKIAKKLRGMHQPDSRKVFVSGLPFEIKQREVEKYFEENCGHVVHCKILTFEDTKRCKGQAFVTFETEESAKKAISSSGTLFDYEPKGNKKKKIDKVAGKKELRLKVTKAVNRFVSKKKSK